jgi:hypothetical protein
MKTTIINSIAEAEALVKDGVLKIDGNLEITCEDFVIEADILVKGDIKACNVEAGDIDVGDIDAWDIKAEHIYALNIDAKHIKAWYIRASNIKAWDIHAKNINTLNIKAWNINAKHIDAWDIVSFESGRFSGACNCASITIKKK